MSAINVGLTRRMISFFLLAIALMMSYAECTAGQKLSSVQEIGEKPKVFSLVDLLGYNYTNRNIDEYTVNGQGGGQVRLSSRTSGGSGIVCCVKFANGEVSPIVRVRWQFDGCTYLTRSNMSGRVHEHTRYSYKEADVEVQRIGQKKPQYLETHFYPDGSVHVALTSEISLPRMSMDENRPDKSQFPRCKDE